MVEIIGNVPPNLTVLPAVLHDSVEETNHEDQRLERLVRALIQRFLGKLGKSRTHVQLQTVGRLSHHLQSLLQNSQREGVGRLRRQPQAEVLVGPRKSLQEFLEVVLEPTRQQVAVLKHQPMASVR